MAKAMCYSTIRISPYCGTQNAAQKPDIGQNQETAVTIWDLSDTISFWRSAPIQICSDSKHFLLIYQNAQRATDPRLLRRLDYLLTTPHLQVTFVPGEYNHIADTFGRISDPRINAKSQIHYTDIPLNL